MLEIALFNDMIIHSKGGPVIRIRIWNTILYSAVIRI